MNNELLILEELRKMNARLDSMENKLDYMEEQLEELKEYSEVTRDGVNSLLEWAEDCGNVIKFPLPKVK